MSHYRFPSTTNATQLNTNNPSAKEFHFSINNFKPSPTRELPSISYLRHKLIPYINCLPNDFYDIPQTILIFTASADDDTYKIPNIVKSRGRIINYEKAYKNVPMNNIIFQNQKRLKSDLQVFLDQIIKPRFRDAFQRIEDDFTKVIVINHQLDDAIQYDTTLSVTAAQYIKQYADYQMMRGEHKVAYSLYHQLLLHFPTEKQFLGHNESPGGIISTIFSFSASLTSSSSSNSVSTPSTYCSSLNHIDCLLSATFCSVSCDIIIGEINDQTVKNLYFLRDNSPNIQYRLIVSLIIFWILPRVGKTSPDVLIEFLEYSKAIVEADQQAGVTPPAVSEALTTQSKTMINSNSQSSLSSIPILSSIHQSFSLNNLANTIYRQLSSDDSMRQSDKAATKLTFVVIVEPYLQEQIIQFYSPRLVPFEYFLLAKRFDQVGLRENYVRCLWNSFILLMNTSEKSGRLQYHNCEFCLSFLIEKIVNVLLREKNFLNQPKPDEEWFLADYIGYLMRFDNIQRLPVFASLFSMWNSKNKFYKTGFIHASVISFSTNDPLLTGPKDYRGNWRQIAVKLFGYTKSSSSQFNFFFFSNDDSSVEEATPISDRISVNDEIRVRVSITNKFDFSVGDTWLRIKGNASSQRVKVGNSKRSEVLYIVKPNKVSENESDHNNGLIQIDGLNILWVNNVNLFTKFSTPIAFRYHERSPSVSIDELSSVHEMFAGDAALLRLVLHVGPVPLTSLMLLIDVDDQYLSTNRFYHSKSSSKVNNFTSSSSFTILSPPARNIGGQFFFGPVESMEEIAVDILCTSTVCGFHSHWLFFSYTSAKCDGGVGDDQIYRYSSYNYNVTVYEKLDLSPSIFPSFCPDFGFDVSLKKVNNDKSYKLTITNNMKCEVENVFVEFFERRINQDDLLDFKDEMLCEKDEFEFNFGCYLSGIEESEGMKAKKNHRERSCIQNDRLVNFHSTFDKFIICGFTKKKFNSIGIRKAVSFCFDFESFDHETYPFVCISINGNKHISDMSTIFHYYDQTEI